MGIYLNPGNKGFRESISSEIYVDKTGLIKHTNKCINTKEKLERYSGEIVLVGVDYDRDNANKPHSCLIERAQWGI